VFSSAGHFDGWRGYAGGAELPRAGPRFHRTFARWVVVSKPRTWLGGTGWRRTGLVQLDEAPSARS
jgi:hypothetical protein